jgi:hypothetical protein
MGRTRKTGIRTAWWLPAILDNVSRKLGLNGYETLHPVDFSSDGNGNGNGNDMLD